ncbi:MAG: HEAT repeat domain-containing protein [Tepidisphaeraceae bacterium]
MGAEKKAAGVGAAVPRLGDLQLMLEELKSSDSVRRAAAAAALGRTADNAAVPGLIAALDDSDADVARQAAKSLGSLGNAAAVDPLVAVVNNREGYFHSAVRIAAIHSLGELRDLRAVVPLLNAIRDPLADASAEAIRALSLLPDPRGVPALLEVVRNENGFFLATTRRAAILGLAHIGGKQALCELRFVASNQWEDATVRAAALEAAPPGSNLVAGA